MFNFFAFNGVKGKLGGKNINLKNYDRDSDNYIFDSFRKCIDFEFEMPLTSHCNLNCQMCTAFSPIANKSFLAFDSFLKDVLRISKIFEKNSIWFRLVGGEPLLHPEINELLIFARKTLPRALISITTNGILIKNMNKSFYQVCKKNKIIILHSPYPPINHLDILSYLQNKNILVFTTVKKFKSRHFGIDISGSQDREIAFSRCRYKCNFLLNGKLCRCFYPLLISHFNNYFNLDIPVQDNDTIDIHTHNKNDIVTFLNHSIPFCKYCNNQTPTFFEWKQSQKQLQEWI